MYSRAVGTANSQQRDVNAAGLVEHAHAVRGAQRLTDARRTAHKALMLIGAEL